MTTHHPQLDHPQQKLILLVVAFIILSGIGFAGSNCADAQSNLSNHILVVFNESCNMLAGQSYTVNATSSSVGAITITADNVVLDCGGSSLVGNGTGRGIISVYNNLTLKNCIIRNYEYGINEGAGHSNVFITNVSIYNTSIQAVRTFSITNLTIEKSYFESYIVGANGVILGDGANYTNFSNNVLNGFSIAFQIYYTSGYGLTYGHNIYNNNISNFNSTGIQLYNVSNTNVYNNRIKDITRITFSSGEGISIPDGYFFNYGQIYGNLLNNTGRHGINFCGWGNNLTYNNISGVNHVAIGMGDETREFQSGGNNSIKNNIIYNVTDGAGISTKDQTNNIYAFNYLDDYYLGRVSAGIEFYNDTNLNYNHQVYNNTLLNWDVCLMNTVLNVNFYNNTLLSCEDAFYLGAEDSQTVTYANTQIKNVISNQSIDFQLRRVGFTNISYESTDTQFIYIRNSNINWKIYLNYTGMHNFSILNSTITLNPISSNYSINFNNGTVLNNVNQATFPVSSNQNVEVSLSSASGGCDYPTEDYFAYGNITSKFCSGIYTVLDLNSNGAILLDVNSTLDCNGAVLIGNGTLNSYGFYPQSKLNITIKNCLISNYSRGIRIATSTNNAIIFNNTIWNNSAYDIQVTNVNNANISNNNLSKAISCIYVETRANFTLIDNNICYNGDISLQPSTLFSIVRNNLVNITPSSQSGIFVNANNSLITNNRIDNPSVDCVNYYGFFNNITNNICTNINKHNGIDSHGAVGFSGNTTITGNIISGNYSSAYSGIYLDGSWQNYVFNNTISSMGYGILTNNLVATELNNISENIIDNVSHYCILASSGNFYSKNIFLDCGIGTFYANGYNSTISIFQENIIDTNYFYYKFVGLNANMSLSEISNQHKINLTNLGILYFNSPIRKVLTIINNTYYAYNLTDGSYNCVSVFNGSSTSPWGGCGSAYNEKNESMPPNNRTIVLNHVSATEAWFSTIATTIQTVNYSTSAKSFAYDCSGSGDITVTNLNTLGSIIYVYHNGVLVDTESSITDYTASGCSNWLFTSSAATHFITETKPHLVDAYLGFAQMMSLIVVLSLVGGIIFIVWKFREGGFDFAWDNLNMWLVGGALALMFATITILIIVYIISTTVNVLG